MLSRRQFLRTAITSTAAIGLTGCIPAAINEKQKRPNILWLTIEDTSYYEFGCYGNKYANTPNIDALAKRGIQFTNAWSTGPQCSPARSTIISGCYSSTYGTEWHRRGWLVPEDQYFFPKLMKQAGYFCTNNSKTDYNAKTSHSVCWSAAGKKSNPTYNNPKRRADQPFFSVFNCTATHMGRVRSITTQQRRDFAKEGLDPAKLELPPHVPDLPEIRSDLAFHQEGVNDIDKWVGFFLDDLKEKGLDEDTIIFFFSDHGGCLPRGKGFLFETGLKVPMILYVPPKYRHLCSIKHGQKSDRLVGFVDLAATVLSIADVKTPDYMQGKAFLGQHEAKPRKLQFGLRCNQYDHYDPWRAVTDGRYTYTRCYTPYKPMAVRNFYQWGMPANLAWDEYVLSGKCTKEQWLMTHKPKPTELLYDSKVDPYGTKNLANNKDCKKVLTKMRTALSKHIRDTMDLGFFIPTTREKSIDLYTWVRQNNYPLNDLLDAVDLASDPKSEDVKQLIAYLQSDKPELKFWGTSGIATLGVRKLTTDCPPELIEAMQDTDMYISATAAEAACYLGKPDIGLPMLMAKFKENSPTAYSSLETLSLNEDLKKQLEKYVPEFESLSQNKNLGMRSRSILVNLGKLPISKLYPEQDIQKGIKVNLDRRRLYPRP